MSLEIVSWAAIILGVVQAMLIAMDVRKNPQEMMPIMNIVWPLTGLFFPIAGIWAYYKMGRNTESGHEGHGKLHHYEHDGMNHQHMQHGHANKPFWQSVFVSTTHCSSGCALGDMIGGPIVFLTGFTVAGSALLADYTVEFVLAYIFGIAFQYYGMGFKKHDEPARAIRNAIKADTLSLIAFEIGMFGWMALTHFVFFAKMPKPNSPVFWFMMQIAMMLGFLTSYPANWVLVKKGIKHAM